MLSLITVNLDPQLRNLNFSPSWDTFLILIFIFAVITYAFFVSRERLAVVLLSDYCALAIMLNTPLITNALMTLTRSEIYTYRLGAFVGLFIILYFLFSHNMSLRSEIGHSWWQALLLSFMQVGLLLSSLLIFIPSQYFQSMVATSYFTGDIARSFWMVAPVAIMLIMRPSHKSPGSQHSF